MSSLQPTRELGIEFISALAMPPVEFVHLAADLDCRHISLAPAPFTLNPYNYPAWSLLTDVPLRRAVAAALRERKVSVSLGEGFLLRPGTDIRDSATMLGALCEVGAKRINVFDIETDRNRAVDQLGTLVDMAAALGVETTLEFAPISTTPNLASAIATIGEVGRAGLRLLIDTMHLVRSGAGAAEVAALDRKLIGYVQICDVPRAFSLQGYAQEAKCERMVPGTGELPLVEIIAALPRDLLLSVEVPQVSLAEAGIDTRTRLSRCLAATRELLERVPART